MYTLVILALRLGSWAATRLFYVLHGIGNLLCPIIEHVYRDRLIIGTAAVE